MSEWTTEKPTTPGWYWYRAFDDADRVVHVMEMGGDDLTACAFEWQTSIKYMNGNWVGPIEPPR
jgi:hypothetical protein